MFDWQTVEDDDWDDTLPEPERPRRPARWRRWLPWLLVVVVLALTSAVLVQRMNARVEDVTSDLEADVVSSHALVAQASAEADGELLLALLSGLDGGWAASQQVLLREGGLWQRNALGLTWEGADTAVPQVQLAPDLLAAEVTSTHLYRPAAAGLDDAPVRLQQTAVYRLGSARWLLAPPTTDFWGETQTTQHGRISASYPARDEALVQRLVTDLDTRLAALCADADALTCAPEMALELHFSHNPSSLTGDPVARAVREGSGPLAVTLPTPTLAGVPQDEAGYAALLRGYAAPVVATAVVRSAGYDCCAQALFVRALVDWQLAEWELADWPVTAVQYANLLQTDLTPAGIRGYWFKDKLPDAIDGMWPVHALVAYVQQRGAQSGLASLRTLLQLGDYEAWLWRTMGGAATSFDALEQDFLIFAYEQAPSATEPVLTVRP